MEGVEGGTGDEGGLVGNPKVTDGIESVCEDNSLFGVSGRSQRSQLSHRSNHLDDAGVDIPGFQVGLGILARISSPILPLPSHVCFQIAADFRKADILGSLGGSSPWACLFGSGVSRGGTGPPRGRSQVSGRKYRRAWFSRLFGAAQRERTMHMARVRTMRRAPSYTNTQATRHTMQEFDRGQTLF